MFLPTPHQAQDFEAKMNQIDITDRRGAVIGQDKAKAYLKRNFIFAKLCTEADFLDTPALQEAILKVIASPKYTFSNGWTGTKESVFDAIVYEALETAGL